VKHHAAIIDPLKLGELLRPIDIYDGSPITKYALQLAPHVFVRPGELCHAEWDEISFETAIWDLSAGKLKARRPRSVPLFSQSMSILTDIGELTGAG